MRIIGLLILTLLLSCSDNKELNKTKKALELGYTALSDQIEAMEIAVLELERVGRVRHPEDLKKCKDLFTLHKRVQSEIDHCDLLPCKGLDTTISEVRATLVEHAHFISSSDWMFKSDSTIFGILAFDTSSTKVSFQKYWQADVLLVYESIARMIESYAGKLIPMHNAWIDISSFYNKETDTLETILYTTPIHYLNNHVWLRVSKVYDLKDSTLVFYQINQNPHFVQVRVYVSGKSNISIDYEVIHPSKFDPLDLDTTKHSYTWIRGENNGNPISWR